MTRTVAEKDQDEVFTCCGFPCSCHRLVFFLLDLVNCFIYIAVLSDGNPDAKRLYDEIFAGYNKLVRPVKNITDPVTVKFKLKFSQLIDVVS